MDEDASITLNKLINKFGKKEFVSFIILYYLIIPFFVCSALDNKWVFQETTTEAYVGFFAIALIIGTLLTFIHYVCKLIGIKSLFSSISACFVYFIYIALGGLLLIGGGYIFLKLTGMLIRFLIQF